tara:strand:+ start:966 stop:1322 length:357 start_codon:yes stop_codon:yes gene_type:complete
MTFIKRLGYFLFGLSIGIVILSFIFSGKKTSCNYGPQARVKNELIRKKINIADSLLTENVNVESIKKFIKNSSVDFSKSNTNKDSCKTYILRGYLNSKYTSIEVENCLKNIVLLDVNL